MRDINKVILTGRLGANPEFRTTAQGLAMTRFSLALVTGIPDPKTEKPSVEWMKVVTWGNLAQVCNRYLKKGSPVLVDGMIRKSTYEKNGEKKVSVEISAGSVQFLSRGKAKEERDSDENGESLPGNLPENLPEHLTEGIHEVAHSHA